MVFILLLVLAIVIGLPLVFAIRSVSWFRYLKFPLGIIFLLGLFGIWKIYNPSNEYYLSLFNRISGLTLPQDSEFISKKHIIIEELYAVLISLEFNTFKIFFSLRDDYIVKKVKKASSSQKKIEVFHTFLKEIKTTMVTSPIKYNPNLPSLKEQLIIWIDEEIVSLQRTMQSSSPTLSKEIVSDYAQNTKRILKLSVSEISLITRLLYEQGTLEGPKKAFFKFLSNTFSTHKTKVISQESLSNRYYSIPDSTKISVKRMLRGMLLKLDKIQSEM